MIREEKVCVGCTSLGLPCLGSACDMYEITYICDECGYETDDEELIYEIEEDYHLCRRCKIKNEDC